MAGALGVPTPSTWFMTFPDSDAGAALASRLRDDGLQEVDHPSGRPWILGRWPDQMMTVGAAGSTPPRLRCWPW